MRIPGTPRTRAALVATASAALLLTPATADARAVDDAKLVPHTHFVMQPDGSSGATAKGAQIPNIDSVKSTIRTYYGADPQRHREQDLLALHQRDGRDLEASDPARRCRTVAPRPQAWPSSSTPTTPRCGPTTWRTGRCTSTSTRSCRTPGSWTSGSRPPRAWSTSSTPAAGKGYTSSASPAATTTQEAATAGQPEQGRLHRVHRRQLLHQVDSARPQAGDLDCYITSTRRRPGQVHDRRVQGRHPQAHRETCGYDIVLNVGDQWSDLQGGYADRHGEAAQPDVLPAEPGPPRRSERADAGPAHRVHDGARRLQRRDRGRRGHPEHRLGEVDDPHLLRRHPGTGIANKTTSPYISEMAALVEQVGAEAESTSARPASPQGTSRPSSSTPTTPRCGPTTWRTRRCTSTSTPALQDAGSRTSASRPRPGMVGWSAPPPHGRLHRRRPDRPQRRPAGARPWATWPRSATPRPFAVQSQYYFTKWTSARPAAGVRRLHRPADATKCTDDRVQVADPQARRATTWGYDIVANFGDQFSDLIGGYADHAVKLPNPTYYLP